MVKLIPKTYSGRTARTFHPQPRDPKTIDRGEILRPRNSLFPRGLKGIFCGEENPVNDTSVDAGLPSTLRLQLLRIANVPNSAED